MEKSHRLAVPGPGSPCSPAPAARGQGPPRAGARAQLGRQGVCLGGSGGRRLKGLVVRERMGAPVEFGVSASLKLYLKINTKID